MIIARTSLAALLLLVSTPVLANELRTKALEIFKPLPSTIPAVKDNKITPEKI